MFAAPTPIAAAARRERIAGYSGNFDALTVTSISPNTGSTAGGETVTITGTGFVDGTTSVTIGGSAATSETVLSGTSMTCVTPAHAAGAGDVVVTKDAQSDTLTDGFTFSAGGAEDPEVYLYVDWGTALGNTSNAIRDGTKLIFPPATSLVLSVVASTDFAPSMPTTNALKVNWEDPNKSAHVRREPLTQASDFENIWHRFWAYVDATNWNGHGMNHPVNMEILLIQTVYWSIKNTTATGYKSQLVAASWSGGSQGQWDPPELDYDTAYMFEYFVEHIQESPLRVRVWPYISNQAGTLLYDADDYTRASGTISLADDYGGGAYINVSASGPSGLTAAEVARSICFGNEGPALETGSSRDYYFMGYLLSPDRPGAFIP